MRNRRSAVGLGRTQRLVLQILANVPGSSARDLAYHWPTLTESSAMAAVNRLADRGLVDLDSVDDRGARTFVLTHAGALVEREVSGINDDLYGDDES